MLLPASCLSAILLLSGCGSSGTAGAALTDPIQTEDGQVAGATGRDPSVHVYKGIPFAAPPVGDLRWKAPQPVAAWEGVRQATEFGNTCSSGAGFGGGGRGKGKGKGKGGAKGDGKAPAKAAPKGPPGPAASEDCLYLNVWTAAATTDERRPVFVWNYGGGFTNGSGSIPGYDGEELAKKGAVVVTYNYRLGLFGAMAHPELTAESEHNASGNYFMMDLATVLRWVQDNIAAFGGDPNRVTIAGESAGAMLVAAMVGSPQGAGLFHRAIAQSGSFMGLGIGRTRTREEAEQAALDAADGKSIAELRGLSTQEVGAALRGVPSGLIVDGWMLPEDLEAIYASGRQNAVDVLIGSNHDEGTFFGGGRGQSAQQYRTATQQRYGGLATDFLALYPGGSDEEAAASGLARFRDELGWHQRTWAKLQTGLGKRAFLFYFTRVRPGQEARGATHTAELPYMFNNPPNGGWTDVDAALADQMSSYWVNFAASGDPNGEGLPEWPAYSDANDGQAMVFGDTTAFGDQIGGPQLAFFDRFFKQWQSQ